MHGEAQRRDRALNKESFPRCGCNLVVRIAAGCDVSTAESEAPDLGYGLELLTLSTFRSPENGEVEEVGKAGLSTAGMKAATAGNQ